MDFLHWEKVSRATFKHLWWSGMSEIYISVTYKIMRFVCFCMLENSAWNSGQYENIFVYRKAPKIPVPTSGLSQFSQKFITLCSISFSIYIDVLSWQSWYQNKRRSVQGKGSGILFTINYIILAVQKRKITYSLTFSHAFEPPWNLSRSSRSSSFSSLSVLLFIALGNQASKARPFSFPVLLVLKCADHVTKKNGEWPLCRSARLNIQCQACSFNGAHYRQVIGVAMGSVNGPKLSLFVCWLVGFVEDQILNQYNGFISQLYRRYVDDVVGAS